MKDFPTVIPNIDLNKVNELKDLIGIAKTLASKYKQYYLSYKSVKSNIYVIAEAFSMVDEDDKIKDELDDIFRNIEK